MRLFASIALAIASSSAFANGSDQFVITGAASKGGTAAYSIDLSTDGRAVVFQAFFSVEGATGDNFDLSKCMSGLPKGWSGKCEYVNGKIVLVGYSPSLTALPAGLQNVGTIGVSRVKVNSMVVSDVEIGARDGSLISSAFTIAE